jgi:HlyD family secretion protein
MKPIQQVFMLTMVLSVCCLSACSAIPINQNSAAKPLTASGTITADAVRLAPEIGGRLVGVAFKKGESVKAGDVVFQLDDTLLQAQHEQAAAAVKVAQAAADLARQKQASAQSDYSTAVQAARLQDQRARSTTWTMPQPDKFVVPNWYFEKTEKIAAAQAEVDTAQKFLDDEQANLEKTLKDISSGDFTPVEKRLAEAQAAYQVADQTLNQAKDKDVKSGTNLADAAQTNLNTALTELDTATRSYNQMLTSDAAKNVLQARSRIAVARARLDNALDGRDQLRSGEDALQLVTAQSMVDQASAAVSQAEANLAQAQAALKVIEAQISKMVIRAPEAGVVLSTPLHVGEIAAPGATVIEVGSLDTVTLTVYIPEDQYGQVKLGQEVKVSTDSFPGRSFKGTVTHIADQAEFTPRNVQTTESRSTTVYAVEISLDNTDYSLKPGMPADAKF